MTVEQVPHDGIKGADDGGCLLPRVGERQHRSRLLGRSPLVWFERPRIVVLVAVAAGDSNGLLVESQPAADIHRSRDNRLHRVAEKHEARPPQIAPTSDELESLFDQLLPPLARGAALLERLRQPSNEVAYASSLTSRVNRRSQRVPS